MTKYLVTGSAGFIGLHVCQKLLERGDEVVGLDNLNDYYSVQLKRDRLARIDSHANFDFHELNIADGAALFELVKATRPSVVIHLAAQAGVRYSLEHPESYFQSNLVGFGNILEACRHHAVDHLTYASSSSIYGASGKMPFSIHDNSDHPVSLYAASKKANELMAHSYSHLYEMPTTGLRFFTVYGPWGRPDMAIYMFTEAILAGRPIKVYNRGQMKRDFTYIDDIVEGVIRTADQPATADKDWQASAPDPGSSSAPYRIYNIGNNNPIELLTLIEVLENALGKRADKRMMPMQLGDVPATFADIDDLTRDTGFQPSTSIEDGIERFVQWYRKYHKI